MVCLGPGSGGTTVKWLKAQNELWTYGKDGPGYIYFSPEEGFQFGEYSLEVWVNGEMLAQSGAIMNSAAAAASN